MHFSYITIPVLMTNIICHSFRILLINLTMDFSFLFFRTQLFFKTEQANIFNLRENKFDKEILRSLGALPVLKSLDLSYNNMWPLSSQGTCISEFSSLRIPLKSLDN